MAKNDPDARAQECAKRIPKDGTFLEIGVWRGANMSRVARLRPDVQLIGVDPWALAKGSYATSGSSDSKLTAEGFEQVYQIAQRNLAPYASRVTLVRMRGADYAPIFAVSKRPRPHVIFIDGDHSYDGCAADIAAWSGLATLWVGGHDFAKASFPGVERAVNEAFGDQGYILGADSTWWHLVTA